MGTPRPHDQGMADSLAGRLLVASPKLVDPNFARAVVCVCAHDAGGAMGVVLNRPLPGVEVAEHLPEWRAALGDPATAFAGGPVEQSAALALGRLRGAAPGTRWTLITARLGLVDLRSEPRDLDELEEMRIFLGYAGWAAGQLEAEIAEDAWFVVAAAESDPFTREPDTLWRDVLRRQGGQLAMFAYFPTEPGLN